MSWKLVLGLSFLGLLAAAATVFLVPPSAEHLVWLAVLGVSAIAIAKRAPRRYFLHGFAVSVVNSVWATAAHLALFDRYVAVHAHLVASPVHVGSPQVMVALAGLVAGVTAGIVVGVLAWGASGFLVSSHSEFAGW